MLFWLSKAKSAMQKEGDDGELNINPLSARTRPDPYPRAAASQSGPQGPWPTTGGARCRVRNAKGRGCVTCTWPRGGLLGGSILGGRRKEEGGEERRRGGRGGEEGGRREEGGTVLVVVVFF